MNSAQHRSAQRRAMTWLDRAGIVLTPVEQARIEVADFGLGDLNRTGLELFTYINTERCCGKELVLFPGQTCPEHWHPPIGADPGKEETFRCRWGEVFLYVPGDPTQDAHAWPPAGRENYYTVHHEVHLKPGDQYTIPPNTRHWFQGGPDGAVVSEFSTTSRDEYDGFTDPDIVRSPKVTD